MSFAHPAEFRNFTSSDTYSILQNSLLTASAFPLTEDQSVLSLLTNWALNLLPPNALETFLAEEKAVESMAGEEKILKWEVLFKLYVQLAGLYLLQSEILDLKNEITKPENTELEETESEQKKIAKEYLEKANDILNDREMKIPFNTRSDLIENYYIVGLLILFFKGKRSVEFALSIFKNLVNLIPKKTDSNLKVDEEIPIKIYFWLLKYQLEFSFLQAKSIVEIESEILEARKYKEDPDLLISGKNTAHRSQESSIKFILDDIKKIMSQLENNNCVYAQENFLGLFIETQSGSSPDAASYLFLSKNWITLKNLYKEKLISLTNVHLSDAKKVLAYISYHFFMIENLPAEVEKDNLINNILLLITPNLDLCAEIISILLKNKYDCSLFAVICEKLIAVLEPILVDLLTTPGGSLDQKDKAVVCCLNLAIWGLEFSREPTQPLLKIFLEMLSFCWDYFGRESLTRNKNEKDSIAWNQLGLAVKKMAYTVEGKLDLILDIRSMRAAGIFLKSNNTVFLNLKYNNELVQKVFDPVRFIIDKLLKKSLLSSGELSSHYQEFSPEEKLNQAISNLALAVDATAIDSLYLALVFFCSVLNSNQLLSRSDKPVLGVVYAGLGNALIKFIALAGTASLSMEECKYILRLSEFLFCMIRRSNFFSNHMLEEIDYRLEEINRTSLNILLPEEGIAVIRKFFSANVSTVKELIKKVNDELSDVQIVEIAASIEGLFETKESCSNAAATAIRKIPQTLSSNVPSIDSNHSAATMRGEKPAGKALASSVSSKPKATGLASSPSSRPGSGVEFLSKDQNTQRESSPVVLDCSSEELLQRRETLTIELKQLNERISDIYKTLVSERKKAELIKEQIEISELQLITEEDSKKKLKLKHNIQEWNESLNSIESSLRFQRSLFDNFIKKRDEVEHELEQIQLKLQKIAGSDPGNNFSRDTTPNSQNLNIFLPPPAQGASPLPNFSNSNIKVLYRELISREMPEQRDSNTIYVYSFENREIWFVVNQVEQQLTEEELGSENFNVLLTVILDGKGIDDVIPSVRIAMRNALESWGYNLLPYEPMPQLSNFALQHS